MDAIETLMTEHRLIEQGLEALCAFADEVRRKAADDRAELGRFVAFIREFADARHHGKEEAILFEAMVQAGFPREGGPVAVMLAEHDQGRAFTGALAALAAQPAPWSGEDRQRVAEAAHGYAGLLRRHIHKEDAILYPMADGHLSAEAMARVSAACDAFDAREAASGATDRLSALAEGLLARHAPLTRGSAPRPAAACP